MATLLNQSLWQWFDTLPQKMQKMGIHLTLWDSELSGPLLREMALRHSNARLEDLPSGLPGLERGLEVVMEQGMFGERLPVFMWELDPKCTAKQWDGCLKILNKLQKVPELMFLARGIPSQKIFFTTPESLNAFASASLLYDPQVSGERVKAHGALSKLVLTSPTAPLETLLESQYQLDFVSSYFHLKRMQNSSCDFQEALLEISHMEATPILEALLDNSLLLFSKRYFQFVQSGGDLSEFLNTLFYFARSHLGFLYHWNRTKNLKLAFKDSFIPYPAQMRHEKALKNGKAAQWLRLLEVWTLWEFTFRENQLLPDQIWLECQEIFGLK